MHDMTAEQLSNFFLCIAIAAVVAALCTLGMIVAALWHERGQAWTREQAQR